MSRELTLQGYVVKQQDLGEADLLLTFFSREQGKVRFVVKSAKKITSRLIGRVQPTAFIEVTLAGNSSLPKLIGAQTLDSYPAVLNNQDAMAALVCAQEFTARALPDGQPNDHLFENYGRLFKVLSDDSAPALVVAAFFVQGLSSLGFAPSINPTFAQSPQIFFSQQEGRFAVQATHSDDMPLAAEVYALYAQLLEQSAALPPAEPKTVIALLKFLTAFTAYQLERPLLAPQYFLQNSVI